MKFPGARKAKRFSGPLYLADSDYGKLIKSARFVSWAFSSL